MNQSKVQRKKRGHKKVLIGKVVSSKGTQTLSVQTQSSSKHPKYKKYLRKSSFFVAHDGKNLAKQGDIVEIVSVRPLSKTKRWNLSRVIQSEGESS